MEQYSILLSIECGPKKMVTNDKLLMSMHVSHGNNKALFVRVIPLKRETFFSTPNKTFVILRYIPMRPQHCACTYWEGMCLREISL